MTASFLNKSNLETLIEGITTEDFHEYLDYLWPSVLESGLSFVVKSKDGSIIAALFSCDAKTNFDYTLYSPFAIIDEFFVLLEKSAKNKLFKNYTRICYAYMLGTVESLTPQENVLVVHFIEQEIIKLARAKNYEGILTMNQSSLTLVCFIGTAHSDILLTVKLFIGYWKNVWVCIVRRAPS